MATKKVARKSKRERQHWKERLADKWQERYQALQIEGEREREGEGINTLG